MRGTRAKRERKLDLRQSSKRIEVTPERKQAIERELTKLKALAHLERNPDNADAASVAKRKRRLARNRALMENA